MCMERGERRERRGEGRDRDGTGAPTSGSRTRGNGTPTGSEGAGADEEAEGAADEKGSHHGSTRWGVTESAGVIAATCDTSAVVQLAKGTVEQQRHTRFPFTLGVHSPSWLPSRDTRSTSSSGISGLMVLS